VKYELSAFPVEVHYGQHTGFEGFGGLSGLWFFLLLCSQKLLEQDSQFRGCSISCIPIKSVRLRAGYSSTFPLEDQPALPRGPGLLVGASPLTGHWVLHILGLCMLQVKYRRLFRDPGLLLNLKL
jgi:hypothetical protein